MNVILLFFWLSLGILFYCYLGYGILAMLLTGINKWFISRAKKEPVTEWPEISLVVTAYNEEAVLEQKIENIKQLDYPPDLLKVFFVTDGSIDRSHELIGKFPFITLLHQPERKGKYSAIKRAMQFVSTPLVLFSDANAVLNKECVRRIVTHYRDPRVGGVAGEKKILYGQHHSAVGRAEGIYWQYESFMKKLDAGLYSIVGAAGELFSIRTNLFTPLNDELILDDLIISMQVCLQGYKIEYEPGAFATEAPSASLAEEAKRKIRISAGAYQSISYLKNSLNIFRHPLLSFQYISRRLFRWVLCPPMLIILLLTNIIIVGYSHYPVFYNWTLIAQFTFYIMAMIGGLLLRSGKQAGLFTIPFYFVFMNYCLVKGFLRFVNGKQTVLWEKSLRQAVE